MTDPNPANNSATDTDTSRSRADLAITKTDGHDLGRCRDPDTYTIVVTNNGPSDVTGATVSDTCARLTGVTWTCVGLGRLELRSLRHRRHRRHREPARRRHRHLHRERHRQSSATGNLVNTATVGVARGGSPTRTRPTTPRPTPTRSRLGSDLAVTKTDGVDLGRRRRPDDLHDRRDEQRSVRRHRRHGLRHDAHEAHRRSPGAASASAGSSCAASGTGDIADTVNLLAGGTATYTVNATVKSSATGNLVTPPPRGARGGSPTRTRPTTRRPTPTRSRSARTWRLPRPTASTSVVPGPRTTYTIVVTNNGPSDVTGATVSDTLPSSPGSPGAASASAGSSCAASGTGDINDTVNLLAGGTVTFTVTATVKSSADRQPRQHRHRGGARGGHRPEPANNIGDRHRHAHAQLGPVRSPRPTA